MDQPVPISDLENLRSKVTHLEEELKTSKAEKAKLEKKLCKAERNQEIADKYNESLREEISLKEI